MVESLQGIFDPQGSTIYSDLLAFVWVVRNKNLLFNRIKCRHFGDESSFFSAPPFTGRAHACRLLLCGHSFRANAAFPSPETARRGRTASLIGFPTRLPQSA
jgi:hypothetical protein